MFTFIRLTRRKATEALIHRASNYPDLLPETLEINKDMTREVGIFSFFRKAQRNLRNTFFRSRVLKLGGTSPLWGVKGLKGGASNCLQTE